MKTAEALAAFYKDCQERGLSPASIRGYQAYLRYFEKDHPDLPTESGPIERFLRQRHETPTKRGNVFKRLQGFYSYLERAQGIPSPVPSKGKVGRPSHKKPVITVAQSTPVTPPAQAPIKLVEGGGTVSSSISISTTELVKYYLAGRVAERLSPRTLEAYQTRLARLSKSFPTLSLSPFEVQKWLGKIKGAYITEWDYWRDVHTFYNWIWRRAKFFREQPHAAGTALERAIAQLPGDLSPLEGIHMARPKRDPPKIVTREQFQKLANLKMPPWERSIFDIIFTTAIRAGELASIRPEYIYPEKLIVKGKTGTRDVAITPYLYKELKSLPRGTLPFHPGNGPLTRFHLYDIIRRRLEEVGAKGIHMGPHQLRHAAATYYLVAGGDLESLRQQMGHTSLETTQIYATMTSEMVHNQVNKVDVLGQFKGNGNNGGKPVRATVGAGTNGDHPDSAPIAPPVSVSSRTGTGTPITAAGLAAERTRGLSSWGELLIIGPKKKPAPAETKTSEAGQLAMAI